MVAEMIIKTEKRKVNGINVTREWHVVKSPWGDYPLTIDRWHSIFGDILLKVKEMKCESQS